MLLFVHLDKFPFARPQTLLLLPASVSDLAIAVCRVLRRWRVPGGSTLHPHCFLRVTHDSSDLGFLFYVHLRSKGLVPTGDTKRLLIIRIWSILVASRPDCCLSCQLPLSTQSWWHERERRLPSQAPGRSQKAVGVRADATLFPPWNSAEQPTWPVLRRRPL